MRVKFPSSKAVLVKYKDSEVCQLSPVVDAALHEMRNFIPVFNIVVLACHYTRAIL